MYGGFSRCGLPRSWTWETLSPRRALGAEIPQLWDGSKPINIWGINVHNLGELPSGELTKSYGKSPFLIGKSAISMAIFNCYVSSPEGTIYDVPFEWQG